MRRLVLTPTYGSYGDVELLSDLLVSMGGVYNVYREGGSIVLELDDGVSPAEFVRRVLDLATSWSCRTSSSRQSRTKTRGRW